VPACATVKVSYTVSDESIGRKRASAPRHSSYATPKSRPRVGRGAGGRWSELLLQSAAGTIGVAVSSLSFRIVFALRMVIFLYKGVPTILFM